MMHKLYYTLLILSLIFLNSCVKEDVDLNNYERKLIVDGWIESGNVAHVILTYTVPYFGKNDLDTNNIFNFVNARAKVSIIEGDSVDFEVLTLAPDDNFFPRLVYKGFDIVGEPGKTYTLIIEDKEAGINVTTQTTIPDPPHIDSAWFALNSKNDSLGTIWVRLNDNANVKNYYRFLFNDDGLKTGYSQILYPNYTDDYFNGTSVDVPIYKPTDKTNTDSNQSFFNLDELIYIKVLAIDKASFDFWQSYYIESFNAFNPFADSKIKLKSNVKGENIIGLWSGYSSKVLVVYTMK